MTFRPASAALLVILIFPAFTPAMELWKFDQMADSDQRDYLAKLVDDAHATLIREGKPDLAKKVETLFTAKARGGKTTVGLAELDRSLVRARHDDDDRMDLDSTAPRLEVEDAFAVTLRNHGIELPPSYFSANRAFTPKHPLTRKDD